MKIGEAYIDIKINDGQLDAQLRNTESKAKKASQNIENTISSASKLKSKTYDDYDKRIREQSKLDAEWLRSEQQREKAIQRMGQIEISAYKNYEDSINRRIQMSRRAEEEEAKSYMNALARETKMRDLHIEALKENEKRNAKTMLLEKKSEEERAKNILAEQTRIHKMATLHEQAIKENEARDERLRKSMKQNIDVATQWDKTLSRIQRTLLAFAAVAAAKILYDTLRFPVQEATKFNEEIEKTKLGIASILTSQGEFTNKYGGAAQGVEKLNASLKMSERIMKQLQFDNLRTIATFEQLAKAFQQTLAPGLSVGFNVDQIRQYSMAMVQAAGAMGVNLDMMAEETRSLLKGTITPRNTLIATYLGITNEDIRRYKDDSQGLFNFLMGKLQAFNVAGEKSQETFAGLKSNVQDAFLMSIGEASTSFFNYMKSTMKDVLDTLLQVDSVTKELKLNPAIVDGFKTFFEVLTVITSALYEITKISALAVTAVNSMARDVAAAGSKISSGAGRSLGYAFGFDPEVKTFVGEKEAGVDSRNIEEEYKVALKYYNEYYKLAEEYRNKAQKYKFLNPIDTMLASYYEGKFNEFKKALELTGKQFELVDGWAINAGKSLGEYSYYSNEASISTEELEKRLKKLIGAFSEVERKSSQLGSRLQDQVISATERYMAAVSGEDPQVAAIKIRYQKNVQDIRELEESYKKQGFGPREIEAYVSGKKYMAEYEYSTSINAKKAEDARKESEKMDKSLPFDLDDVDQNIDKALKETKKSFRILADMNDDYLLDVAKRTGDFYKTNQIEAQNWIKNQTRSYEDSLERIRSTIDETWDKVTKAEKRGKFVEPEVYEELNELEKTYKEIYSQQEKYLDQINQKGQERLDLANKISEIEADESIAQLEEEYSKLNGSLIEQAKWQNILLDLELERRTANLDLAVAQNAQFADALEQLIEYKKYMNDLKVTGSVLDGFNESLRKWGRDAPTTFDIGTTLFNGMRDSIEGAATSLINFTTSGATAFEDFGRSVINTLKQIAVQMMVTGIMNIIGKAAGSYFGGGGGGEGANYASMSSGFTATLGGRASGGPVSALTPYIVGERGPELFVPKTSGYIHPNGTNLGSNIQTTITVNAQLPASTGDPSKDKENSRTMGREIARAVRDEFMKNLAREQRAGGALNRGVQI